MENEQKKLDFVSFIKKYFEYYKIDKYNQDAIGQISLWAAGSPAFEKKAGQYLQKGLWLIGPVGTGKTDIFHLLSVYLGKYINSRYAFRTDKVWRFTNDFSKNGYSVFDGQERGNVYYDEFCLINERTQWADKEEGVHFGKKNVLMGEEIITLRYDAFKYQGYLTHFSSNAPEEEVERVYGKRAYDRAKEMCNIFVLAGDSRRSGAGHMFDDRNQPRPPAAREVSVDYMLENKQMLEQHYTDFLAGNQPATNMALMFDILSSYGVQVATEDELRDHMDEIAGFYTSEAPLIRCTPSEKEKIKQAWIWEQSRKAAVGIFFTKLKTAGSKSIFGERGVGEIGLPSFKS